MIRNKPHNNQLCAGLSRLISAYPVGSHFLRFAWQTTIAEQERLTIKQRQAEGIAVAKEKGKHLGRPKAEFPPDWNEIYHAWKRGELTAVAAMNELNMKRSTFYKLAKMQEDQK